MKKFLALFLAVLCFSLSNVQAAQVSGRVINGSSDPARPAANVEIELVRPGGLTGQASAVVRKMRTDAQGRFNFADLKVAPKEFLTTRVKTPGFDYETPALDAAGILKQFLPDDAKPIDPKNIEMTIFDAVETVPLVFTVHHVAIKLNERQLEVVERIVAENNTRTTMVGGKDGATIKLNLPPTAHDVELDNEAAPGGKLIKKGEDWWVVKPITPAQYGSRNAIIVKYHSDFQGGTVDLSRKLAYPARFFFMAREQKDKELKIVAPQLGKDEVPQIPIDGKVEDRIVNSKGRPQGEPVFAAGTDITMRVSRPTDPMQWGFVAFIAVICLVVPGALLLMRRPKQRTESAEPAQRASVLAANRGGAALEEAPMPSDLNERARALVDEIAALDDVWDAGDITRNEYQARRASLKSQLQIAANEQAVPPSL